MITASLTTGCRLEIQLTATNIRESIWRYIRTLEQSAEQELAREHGQPLFQIDALPDPRYIRVSFLKDFPDIVCMHESVGLFRGLSLEVTLARETDETPFVRKAWRDEHSIHAIWEGFHLDEFATSWMNLVVALEGYEPIIFQHMLGLHPDTFPTISAELLPLFSHRGRTLNHSNQ